MLGTLKSIAQTSVTGTTVEVDDGSSNLPELMWMGIRGNENLVSDFHRQLVLFQVLKWHKGCFLSDHPRTSTCCLISLKFCHSSIFFLLPLTPHPVVTISLSFSQESCCPDSPVHLLVLYQILLCLIFLISLNSPSSVHSFPQSRFAVLKPKSHSDTDETFA